MFAEKKQTVQEHKSCICLGGSMVSKGPWEGFRGP